MKKAILINRVLMTSDGWSYNFQNRIEEGFKRWLNILVPHDIDIIFYPRKKVIKMGDLFNNFMELAVTYAVDSMKVLKETKEFYDIQHIVFLEPFQFPHMQLIGAGLNKTDYSVFMHSSMEYNEYYNFDDLYKRFYTSFQHLLVNSNYTGKLYDTKYSVIGGILNKYKKQNKNSGKVIWAGSREGDVVKGYDVFLNIVKDFPNINFVMCVDEMPKVYFSNLKIYHGLSSLEYIEKCKECEFILSTAREETFGYSVFDAMAVGLKPIVPYASAYIELFYAAYMYKDMSELSKIFAISDGIYWEEDLMVMVNKYSGFNFVKNLIGAIT